MSPDFDEPVSDITYDTNTLFLRDRLIDVLAELVVNF